MVNFQAVKGLFSTIAINLKCIKYSKVISKLPPHRGKVEFNFILFFRKCHLKYYDACILLFVLSKLQFATILSVLWKNRHRHSKLLISSNKMLVKWHVMISWASILGQNCMRKKKEAIRFDSVHRCKRNFVMNQRTYSHINRCQILSIFQ